VLVHLGASILFFKPLEQYHTFVLFFPFFHFSLFFFLPRFAIFAGLNGAVSFLSDPGQNLKRAIIILRYSKPKIVFKGKSERKLIGL